MTLDDQIAIATGGARGIGRAICLKLAETAATVVAIDLNREGLSSLAEEARSKELPGKIVPKTMDVTDRPAVDALIDGVVEEFGKIDILINNAGITRDGLLMNMED
ncbi:MAG: SDR family NAD(P)-dependent oxidoreductase, partial [Planctomycetota bacterium]